LVVGDRVPPVAVAAAAGDVMPLLLPMRPVADGVDRTRSKDDTLVGGVVGKVRAVIDGDDEDELATLPLVDVVLVLLDNNRDVRGILA
jgi:hypothetical protein